MYVCLDCGQREALTQHLRMQIRIFHGAPETQPLLLFIYACGFSNYPTVQGVPTLAATAKSELKMGVYDQVGP